MTTVIASRPQYRAHLDPITAALGDVDATLVASYTDLRAARRRHGRIVLAQHGAGQSYGGDPRSARNPAYAGGADNDDVGLFLVPNEHAAARWREAYPNTPVSVVGCPRLDTLPPRQIDPLDDHPVVAVSFHWDARVSPEASSAFPWYRRMLAPLAERYKVLGHGHPRRTDLPRVYRSLGIETVTDFDEVCRRADVYVCDNSSTLFEFAATGRPVVVLNAPGYRKSVDHGLRFWDAAGVGVNVDEPAATLPAVECALADREEQRERRERALQLVYAHRTGAAQRAADAIKEWAA